MKSVELYKAMLDCYTAISNAEKRAFEGDLTIKEIHLIEAVYDAISTDSNNFTSIANRLGITLGTLTASFARLEQKGYLKKERYLVDMRVYYIKPTPKAEAIHKRHVEWHLNLVKQFSTEQSQEKYIDMFKAITNTNMLQYPK